jgi:hypothetical protein
MPTLPTVKCPRCRGTSEYQTTIEMLDPPVGKIDIGYCAACTCLFEHIRETGTAYESTAWLPVCRTCRQPVSFAAVSGPESDQIVQYECRDHKAERWEWHRPTDRWTRVG